MSGIIEKLRLAQISSCTCMTKTPEVSWHDVTCRYRVLSEAVEAITMQMNLITSLRAELTEAYGIAYDPGKPGGDMTATATFTREGDKLTLLSIEHSEPAAFPGYPPVPEDRKRGIWPAPTITMSLEEARKLWSSHGAPFKPCAARIGGVDCQASRADLSLFCQRHQHASNRIHVATITGEGLDLLQRADEDRWLQMKDDAERAEYFDD